MADKALREETYTRCQRVELALRALLERLAQPPAGVVKAEDIEAIIAILEGRAP